jgi:endoglucanase
MDFFVRGALHRFVQVSIVIGSLCLIVALPAQARATPRHAQARRVARHRCRATPRRNKRTDQHRCAAASAAPRRHRTAKPKAGKAKPKAGAAKPKAGAAKPKAGAAKPIAGTAKPPVRPAIPGHPATIPPLATPAAPASAAAGPSSSTGGRLAGDQFYVNPGDSAVSEVRSLTASGQVSQANALGVIASEPEAIWLTSAGSASASAVSSLTGAAAAGGKVPVLVAYDLPWRDCGQFSSGGAASPAAYESFVDGLVSGIGQRKVVIIVEPDALSEVSCLPASEQQSYYQLLHYAALRLGSDANAAVYVDAGHTGWQSAAVEASGVSQVLAGTNAAGFAVNVSNFVSTAADISYGTAISQLAGGRHFVIDTSRNAGSVPAGQWCNPPGARLGQAPTTVTGNALVDADLWIKTPGESDGTCNGGPSAGAFWLSYALQLVS